MRTYCVYQLAPPTLYGAKLQGVKLESKRRSRSPDSCTMSATAEAIGFIEAELQVPPGDWLQV